MKNRHNKKRNTAFVYEALIKEATAAIIKEQHDKKNKIISLIKKYFNPRSILSKDLDCYRSLYETQNIEETDYRRVIAEARQEKSMIDPEKLFKLQSSMISDINKEIDSDIFNNFVPNYKTLATIDQLFSVKTSAKSKIMLENELVANITRQETTNDVESVDNITINTFISKFNEKYTNELLEEQKTLLTQFITSFEDNSLQLKMFLNSEISRLKEELNKAYDMQEFIEDKEMTKKLDDIVTRLDSFSSSNIDENVILTVLKTQKLIKGIQSDGIDS
tara:strand:- start:194 stop:1024 length:831 start_codon:yes stop_codon:yes gene_type:complete